tara:strand:- start:76 stop:309 length:234 start_codon:yes stop_codon:yes gene_type:complete
MKKGDYIRDWYAKEAGIILSMERESDWPNRKTIKVNMMGNGWLSILAGRIGPQIRYLSRRDFNVNAGGHYEVLEKTS